jgi:uncharacterized protein (TIGR03083 family)
MTPAELYADVRLRLSDLVRELPDEAVRVPAPGCPGWTVHDVLAHVTGIVADVNADRMEGAPGNAWTQRHVDSRRDLPTAAVLDEWSREAATFEPTLNEMAKPMWRAVVVDLVTHEHDARGGLGAPGGRDGEAYTVSRKVYAVGLAKAIEAHGLPGLRLSAPDWSFDCGADVAVTATAPDSFEFFRALAGRRGLDEIRSWEWSGDLEPYLPVLNHFGPVPEGTVGER